MFNKKDTYKEKYELAVNDLSAANENISKLNAQIDENIDTIQDLNNKLAIIDNKYKAELDIEKIKYAELEKSVNAKVNNILATMGVTNFAVETISTRNTMSPQEALNKFMSLQGSEKNEFYKSNKDLVTQGLALQTITKG